MICGIDEAGRGPVIGPMTVGAVWLEPKEEDLLIDANVRDSKKLVPSRRLTLAEYIMTNFRYEIIVVDAVDIDSLRKIMTINQLEAFVFAKLANKCEADTYYIDSASANEEEFKHSLENLINYNSTIVCRHGADDMYAVVSAASIIAKVERDKQIEIIAKELEKNLGIPLGSGYPSDVKTIKFIKEWIKEFKTLPPQVRKSWKTIGHIENELRQKRLF